MNGQSLGTDDDIDSALAEAETEHERVPIYVGATQFVCQKNGSTHFRPVTAKDNLPDYCKFCDGPSGYTAHSKLLIAALDEAPWSQRDPGERSNHYDAVARTVGGVDEPIAPGTEPRGDAELPESPEDFVWDETDAALDADLAAELRKSVPRPWPRIAHAPVSPLPIGNHLDPEFPMNGPRGSIFDMHMEIPEDMEGNSVPHNLGVYPNGGGSMFDPGPDPGPWNRWGVSREAYQRAREPMRPRRVRVIDRLMLKGAWVLELALEAMLARVALLKNELEYRVGGIRPEDMMNLSDYMEPPSLHEELGVHVSPDDDFSHASLRRLGVWGPTERWDGEAGIFRKFW